VVVIQECFWNIDVRWCCFKEDNWQIFEVVKQLKVKEKKL